MPAPRKSEFQLIEAFARRVRAGRRAPGVVAGIGDDAAVLRPGAGEDWVVTTDAMVEGRHFRRAWFTGRELGRRLAAINLSDLAAMAATPRYALTSFAIPSGVDTRYVEDTERGVVETLARHGAVVVGGNVSSTDGPLVLDLTLIGTCKRGRAWLRRARAGDAIVVAGGLGAAAAGIASLERGVTRGPLVRAYKRPEPRLDVVAALARSRGVHGAIDVSDGLSSDLIHLCEASRLGCGIDEEALPIPAAVRAFCREAGADAIEWSLHHGEDYALILSVARQHTVAVLRAIRRAGCPATVIGGFTPRRGVYQIRDFDTRARPFRAHGWDHLRNT